MKRTTPLKSDPEKTREFHRRGAANATQKRRPISPASKAQREKIKGRLCVNCGLSPTDPAHLTSRAQGGCDHPDCVIPLCRLCHSIFDGRESGQVDLEPVLALRQFSAERSHMASHMSLAQCIQRLRGRTA